MHRTTVLASITGLVAGSLLVVAPVAPASGVTAGDLRLPHQRHPQEAARVRDARRRPRAPGGPAGDRRRQRWNARRGHARLPSLGRLRGWRAAERRLQRHACSRSPTSATSSLAPAHFSRPHPAASPTSRTSTSSPWTSLRLAMSPRRSPLWTCSSELGTRPPAAVRPPTSPGSRRATSPSSSAAPAPSRSKPRTRRPPEHRP